MKKLIPKLAAIVACGYAAMATAQINFNVNMGSGFGANPNPYTGTAIAPDAPNGTNWNTLIIPSFGYTTPVALTNVLSSRGIAFPGVSITFSNHAAGGPQYVWSDTTGGAPPNPVDLMANYTFFATYDVVITGLAPGKYDFWYYGHGDQPNQQGTVNVNTNNGGGTFKTANSALGRDLIAGGLGVAYTNFTGLTVSNDGVFRFTADYLNGFQLQPSQPEGPAFVVTGTDGCSNVGVTPGLAGSVTTNTYLLYRDGVNTGTTPIVGTGSALSFGLQTTPGTYTIVATNPATATSGLMYGKVKVYQAGVAINTQPASASVVSNLPASFTVVATGDSLTYQWYKGGVALTNGGTMSGAQAPTLSISAVQFSDAGNYTVVVLNPCSGNGVTSAPPATLTVTNPRNLVWSGGNPGNSWNLIDQEFLLGGSPTGFGQGDNVTFNDSSSQQSVIISNNVTPTLVSVTGTKAYTFGGPNKITGVSRLVDSSSGTLTIINANDFIGGTVISNGASLSLGDGNTAANNGSLAGTVTVNTNGTLTYAFAGSGTATTTLNHGLAGSGTVNCATANGSVIQSGNNSSSTGFTGTINVQGYTALHGSATGANDVWGKGSTINVLQDGGQIWLDPQSNPYDHTFNIQGSGRITDTPALGALRIFNTTVLGHINLLANSRIGGSISGGTIRAPISGAFEMEVLGTDVNGFNLQIGPTNGTHSYSSTRITAGIVTALNNAALSTGPLTIEPAGKLRLNGNNLTVASLNTADSGTVAGTNAVVLNNSSSAASVLTVGSAGTADTYGGLFTDGSTKSLGLTKVGSGTFTVSGNNNNTGPITVNGGTLALSGSGTFDTASSIIVGSGAFYDVTGASGTVNRGNGQTLAGIGQVNGNVVASSGSIIAPGTSSIGTLTVAGNVSLTSATLAMKVNTPNTSDKLLTSGGSITSSGSSLTVSNVGPVLHVGDTFTFFAGGLNGVTAPTSTVDVRNAVTYTWTSNLGGNGSITVASVTAITAPTLTNSISGNTITFSWSGPFKLQSQTNSLSTGLGTNWFDYPNGSVSPVTATVNSNNPAVFFRLKL